MALVHIPLLEITLISTGMRSLDPQILFRGSTLSMDLRLNLQHHLWKDIFGYSLSPKIPRDKKFLKVADVGTGTGYECLS